MPPVAASTLFVVILSFLPEALHLRQQLREKKLANSTKPIKCQATLGMTGLGCVSCASKVTAIAESVDTVVGVSVSVEEALAKVYFSQSQHKDSPEVNEILERCKDAGFPAEVVYLGEKEESSRPPTASAKTADGEAALASASQPWYSGWIAAIVAGLASSSCCLLQLGLNLLAAFDIAHIGCAGFNKTLGPVRWYFRGATLLTLTVMWGSTLRTRGLRAAARDLGPRTLLTLVLMFLPEILLYSGAPAQAPPTDNINVLQLKLNGMGCEACQLHVQQVLQGSSGVVAATVNFKAGTARVTVAKDWGFDLNATSKKLAHDGYEILDVRDGAEINSTDVEKTKHGAGRMPVKVKKPAATKPADWDEEADGKWEPSDDL